jgi:C-terminal region of Mon2 protein/Dimerisation and cyclophilin-binding domain of Mon2/Guanine nucleotide exchange factor in Golgi transport N-terminal
MSVPTAEEPALLSPAFLRSLESDLRALCADAKRRSPSVKATAEHVILLLREADTAELSRAAADTAAAAFCAACDPPDTSGSSAAYAEMIRIVIRAVSCLHKLLTHRAVLPQRLPECLDVLERLGVDSSDDAITLKVLQALLALLTSRSYVRALPPPLLARAVSLLFRLRTRSSATPSSLAAIASVDSPADDGVIEVTAQAAFRQVASDLFTSAAAAMSSRSGTNGDADSDLPSVVQAAHDLFQDMCSVVAGDDLHWLSLERRSSVAPVLSLDTTQGAGTGSSVSAPPYFASSLAVNLVLALEVMEDGLARNEVLFASSAIFSRLLSSRLCPAVHELLRSSCDRPVLKATFGLIVTLIRQFWTHLIPDSEVLLACAAKIASIGGNVSESPSAVSVSSPEPSYASEANWAAVYAVEALRSTLRVGQCTTADEKDSIIVSMFRMFDMKGDGTTHVVADMLRAVCRSAENCASAPKADMSRLPIEPLQSLSKAFAAAIGDNLSNFYVASSAGLCLSFCGAVKVAAEQGQDSVVSAMLTDSTVQSVIGLLTLLISKSPPDHLGLLLDGVIAIALAGDKSGVASARSLAVEAIACGACASLNHLDASSEGVTPSSRRVTALYQALFSVQGLCGERLGGSWIHFVEAAKLLDVALHGDTAPVIDLDQASSVVGAFRGNVASASVSLAVSNGSLSSQSIATVLSPLEEDLEAAFERASSMSWSGCGDLVEGLIVSSRASVASLAKSSTSSPDDVKRSGKSQSSRVSTNLMSELRIFGMVRTEAIMSSMFSRASVYSGPMPQGLWPLVSGHFVTVACNSPVAGMRSSAIRSFVRIASFALDVKVDGLVAQDKVVCPLLDLLSSSFADAREGCLDAMYRLLEARGECLKGSGAWTSVLSILSASISPGQHRPQQKLDGEQLSQHSRDMQSQLLASSQSDESNFGLHAERVQRSQSGEAMVQRGFQAVQLIADDFLPFLAFETLSQWVVVVGAYGLQGTDVNVALTAVGMLWRTADFLAKSCDDSGSFNALWMELFVVLKALGSDHRPEVRNGAIKTLASSLKAHGSKLSATAWKGCIERALLPLIEAVMRGGGFETEPPSAVALGSKSRNKASTPLVLHYTRDTPRKQWNETRVLALGGVSSVLRAAMPTLARLQDDSGKSLQMILADGGTNSLWTRMLRAAGSAASSKENEIALAGVMALLELLKASGSTLVDGYDVMPSLSSPEALDRSDDALKESSSWLTMPSLLGSTNGSTPLTYSSAQGAALSDKMKLAESGDSTCSASSSNNFSQYGPIMLWEAVWSALHDAVCAGGSAPGDVGITHSKSLVVLASGLGAARHELARCFTVRSSIAFLDILMRLMIDDLNVAVGLESSISRGGRGVELGMTDVQRSAVSVVETLSFGNDVKTWSALVERLLDVIGNPAASQESMLVRRLICLVQSLYDSERMPDEVKAAKVGRAISTLGRVMQHGSVNAMESLSSSASPISSTLSKQSSSVDAIPGTPVSQSSYTKDNTPALTNTKEGESSDILWIVAANAFMAVLCHGLKAGMPDPQVWGTLRQVSFDFLYTHSRDFYDTQTLDPRYLAEHAVAEKYDVRIAQCLRDALRRMPGSGSPTTEAAKLVDLLARGSEEGLRRRRPRFVRSCQSGLFSLADSRWMERTAPAGQTELESSIRREIANHAASCVVRVSDSVLGRFVADGKRAGKCPLPAARRAEAVFLLRRLQALRLHADGQDARLHLRTLNARLCECVDTSDESVRWLARAVLDESTTADSTTLSGTI